MIGDRGSRETSEADVRQPRVRLAGLTRVVDEEGHLSLVDREAPTPCPPCRFDQVVGHHTFTKFGIEIPPDFMMVGKALMTLEGIGKQLDPDLDIFGEMQPHFVKLLKQRYSPQRLGNELIRGVEQLSRAGYDVPLQAREVLEDLRLGRLQVKTLDPTIPAAADRLGRRVFSGLVVASSTVGGAVTFAHDHTLGGILLGASAVILVLHVLLDVRRGPKSDG
jgi:ubiquinone biosynthesis protein